MQIEPELVGGELVAGYPFEFHVPCKSGDEVDAVLMRLDDFSYSRTSVNPPSEESSGAEKSTVTFLPATGSSSNNVGKVW